MRDNLVVYRTDCWFSQIYVLAFSLLWNLEHIFVLFPTFPLHLCSLFEGLNSVRSLSMVLILKFKSSWICSYINRLISSLRLHTIFVWKTAHARSIIHSTFNLTLIFFFKLKPYTKNGRYLILGKDYIKKIETSERVQKSILNTTKDWKPKRKFVTISSLYFSRCF